MNSNNYCSLEMSKKLVEAGIVLETDKVWRLGADGWKLLSRDWAIKMMSNTYEIIPAPSMSELWAELPYGSTAKTRAGVTYAIDAGGNCEFESSNPCDALAELLIWVSKEAK